MSLFDDIVKSKKDKNNGTKETNALYKSITNGTFKKRIIPKIEEEKQEQKVEETKQEQKSNIGISELKTIKNNADTNVKNAQSKYQNALLNNNINAKVVGTDAVAQLNYKDNKLEVGQKPTYDNTKLAQDVKNAENLREYKKTDEGKAVKQEVQENWNKRAEAISNYEVAKAIEDSKNESALTKFAMAPIRGGASVFSWTRGDLNADGKQYASYNEAKMQADTENMDSTVARLGYNALSEIGKQTVVQMLNKIVPFSGTTAYFTDIANDQYNSAINEGYDEKSALNYALLSTGAEAIFERFLGAGSNYFGKKMGAENIISGTLSKFIKNKKANDLISSFISEGGEEFLEEYLGEFNKQLTLDKNVDLNKVFTEEGRLQNAIESMIVGGLVGSTGASVQHITNGKVRNNYDQALYSIERKNGAISDYNKAIIENDFAIAEQNGINLKANDYIKAFEAKKQAQLNVFQDSALEQFDSLDQESQRLYNNLINDASKLIYDTGTNVRFDSSLNTLTEWQGNTLFINPTLTNMPIKTILLQELGTQLLDNTTKSNIIKEMKKNGVYNALKQELLNSGEFTEENVDNEIISRQLNEILSNQEKLEEFAGKNKNAISNLKSLVNDLVAKITNNRNTKDSSYIRDLGEKLNKIDVMKNNISGKELLIKQIENKNNLEAKEKTQNQINNIKLTEMEKGYTQKEKNEIEQLLKVSEDLLDEIKNKTNNNMEKHKDVHYINIPNLNVISNGYRDFNKFKETIKDIKKNGLTTPITAYIDENGQLLIKNGVHRAYIAENLGLDKVPVEFTNEDKDVVDNYLAGKYNNNKGEDNGKSGTKNITEDVKNETGNNKQSNESSEQQNNDEKADKVRDKISKNANGSTTTTGDSVSNGSKGNVVKERKTYQSIMDSEKQSPEAKKVAKELLGLDTYIPDSNEKQLARADEFINKNGVDDALKILKENVDNNKIKADDIATGERLIEYFAKTGEKEKLQDAIQTTAMAGTIVGRSVQAMSLISRQSPAGQATWIQRSVDKMNKQLKEQYDKSKNPFKKLQQFNFTADMQEKIINSTKENLDENLNEVYSELGEQVQMSALQAIDTWRYFAMLSSPTTHIRNIVGNLTMGKIQGFKNKLKGGIEDIYYGITGKEGERTGTLKITPKEYKEYAAKDIENVKGQLGIGDNKYTKPKTKLEENMRMFGTGKFGKFLEKTVKKGPIDFTSKALEVEDIWGLKAAYKKSMAQYLYANKIDLNNITDKQLAKARAFAIEQAKQATFHQDSAIASALNTIENQNLLTKVAVGGVIPFKKTPINVAKTALEYNPITGLLGKTLVYDSVQLYNGKITANQYIDDLAKGLTGTGISILGYALAKAGIIKTSGDDDDDFEEDQGKQPYSLMIGDKSISLDWLSPTAIPLFVGAELCNQIENDKNDLPENEKEKSIRNSVLNVLDAGVSSLNPISEMTMLSGIQSAMKSYSGNYAKMLEEMGANTIKSYVNQIIPSINGKIAKSTDEYERSTTSTSKSTVGKAFDAVVNQYKSKSLIFRKTLPKKTDVWGNEIKQEENALLRTAYNLTSPANIKTIRETDLDKEISRLYEATGDKKVLPKTYIDKYFKYDNKEYRLTQNEYAIYKQRIGQNNYNTLSNLIKSKDYKSLSNADKAKLIEEIYSYDKSKAKDTYASSHAIKYTPDKTYTAQKKSIALGGNIEDYLLYKLQDFKADKDSEGNSIKYSKSKKIFNYLNSKPNMNYNQKLYLLGKEVALSNEEKTYLANLINTSFLTKAEKNDLYDDLKGFKVLPNGTVRW